MVEKKESRKDIESKLIQIQKWLYENRALFAKHEISVVFAFSKLVADGREMIAFSGGKGADIAATSVGILSDLLDDVEDEEDMRELFNLTAGRICKKFEKRMREEGYLDDDGDEEEEEDDE